jgi:hypothetical protein
MEVCTPVDLTKELGELETKIVSRMRELESAVRELDELRALAKRLGLDTRSKPNRRSPASAKRTTRPTTASAPAAAKATASHTAPAKGAPTARLNGAPRARRSRAEQVLALVSERPGIKVSELGKELKVDPTSLYSVVRRLQAEKRIRKEGPELHLAA